ncbi:hypothetical protein [Nocardiopsis gilva]|uniref:hypothetical protein n=1 Tax=Nocardiopsis gilva TaxID=280236 RepID=UPI0012694AE7|nr:hypothetical protein [Nocardiopsis gilva]
MPEIELPCSWKFRIRAWHSGLSPMYIVGRDDDTKRMVLICFSGVARARVSMEWRGFRLDRVELDAHPREWQQFPSHSFGGHLYRITSESTPIETGYILAGNVSIQQYFQRMSEVEQVLAEEHLLDQVSLDDLFQ